MQGVVGFDDILAAVVEIAVAKNEAETAKVQIILVVAFDGVGDNRQSYFVGGSMPACRDVVGTDLYGLVHFSVGVGFVLSFVPTEAAKDAQVRGQFLFSVEAEAVLECAEVFVKGDCRRGIGAVEKRVDCFAVGAHVSAVGKEQDAGSSAKSPDEAVTQFELAVLPVGAAECPVQVDSVSHDRHCEYAVTKTPFGIVIFDHAIDGVIVSVGGVIPRIVVVDGLVHKLKMAV